MSNQTEFQEWIEFLTAAKIPVDVRSQIAAAYSNNLTVPGFIDTVLGVAGSDQETIKQVTNICIDAFLAKVKELTEEGRPVVKLQMIARAKMCRKNKSDSAEEHDGPRNKKQKRESEEFSNQLDEAFESMRFVKNQPQLEQAILDLISPHLEDPNSKLRQLVDQDCVPGFKFLDKHKLQRIDENAIARSYISILHGPSGSGKTRSIFEYLSEHYGVFITASTFGNGGSRDFENLLKASKSKHLDIGKSVILLYKFQTIVTIRLQLLRILRERFTSMSPLKWLKVQEMPVQIFGTDIFLDLSLKLTVPFLPQTIVQPEDYFPIFVDEAQTLMVKSIYSEHLLFCSASKLNDLVTNYKSDLKISVSEKDLTRSATSPIVLAISQLIQLNSYFRFLLAGTGFQVDDQVDNYLGATLLKSYVDDITYIALDN